MKLKQEAGKPLHDLAFQHEAELFVFSIVVKVRQSRYAPSTSRKLRIARRSPAKHGCQAAV